MKKIRFLLFVLLIPVLIFSADSKIDSLHNKLKETAKNAERIELLIELSVEYVDIDTIRSFELSKQAVELSNQLGKHKAKAIGNSGYIYYLTGNHELSLKLLLTALTQLNLENDLKVRADILKNIGSVFIKLEQYNRALEYFNKALNINLKLELKRDILIIYSSIGSTYALQDKYKKALEYYYKSLSLNKELDDKKEMAVLYYNIGYNYELLAEYGKALESYFDCLKINEELNDEVGIADSYNVIGNIFVALEDYDIALEYYNKYLKVLKNMGHKYGLSIAYNNLGNVYSHKKDNDKALEYYFIALKIDKELNDKEGISAVTNNLGIIYYELKEYDKALEYYQQSLSISQELNDIWAMANTSNNIAELYLDLAQYTKSFSYVNKGFEYAESIEVRDLILESFHIYSKLYSKTNNYQKAFEYYKKYTDLKDTLFTTSIKKVAEIQMVHETEKKKKENELLRKDNEIKDLQIEKQKNLKYSLFTIILLIIFFLLLVFKLYQDIKREHLLISEKNKLITQQKDQLDYALKELKELNLNLEKRVEEVKISREHLQMLNKIIRHDLSNDFAVIKSAIRLYKKSSETEMLDEIDKRVTKGLDTIKRQRKQESFIETYLDLDEYKIEDVINETAKNYSNIEINVSGSGIVYADDAIYSVFTNLITNSIKHGKASEVEVNISSKDTMCKIEFIDNGTGILDEIREKIFDEGFTHGESGNTGIGLHIVKHTIERYGGDISVEDNKPNGALFVINLRCVINKVKS